jgi:hypothetical protein
VSGILLEFTVRKNAAPRMGTEKSRGEEKFTFEEPKELKEQL